MSQRQKKMFFTSAVMASQVTALRLQTQSCRTQLINRTVRNNPLYDSYAQVLWQSVQTKCLARSQGSIRLNYNQAFRYNSQKQRLVEPGLSLNCFCPVELAGLDVIIALSKPSTHKPHLNLTVQECLSLNNIFMLDVINLSLLKGYVPQDIKVKPLLKNLSLDPGVSDLHPFSFYSFYF